MVTWKRNIRAWAGVALLVAGGTAHGCEAGLAPVTVSAQAIAANRAMLDRPMTLVVGTPMDVREVAARLQALSGVCVEVADSVGQSVPRTVTGYLPEDDPVVHAIARASNRAPSAPVDTASSTPSDPALPPPLPVPPPLPALPVSLLVHTGIDRTPLMVPAFAGPRRASTLRGVLDGLSSRVGARWWFDPRNGSVLIADSGDPVWGAIAQAHLPRWPSGPRSGR